MHTLEQKGAGRMEERARLAGIDQDRTITKETDPEFWFQYQRAILLALKDDGILNEIQYRYAEDRLKDQFHTFVKKQIPWDNGGEGRRTP